MPVTGTTAYNIVRYLKSILLLQDFYLRLLTICAFLFLFHFFFFFFVDSSHYEKQKKKKKQYKNNNNLRDKPVEQAHYCVEVFQIITWKERTVYVLSKTLHLSVFYSQNESCLAYKETEMG